MHEPAGSLLVIPADWLPTADNINALPEPLRRYIMHLETRGDPALNLREKIQLQDQIQKLEAWVAELTGGSPAG